jgi:hypothetical protein
MGSTCVISALMGLVLVLASVGSCPTWAAGTGKLAHQVGGTLITILTPRQQEFELALDEVEMDWGRTPGAKARALGRQANPAGVARIVDSGDVRARAEFPPVANVTELEARAAALRAANPGAEVHLVMYEPGRTRSKATRRLLTREVGLLLEPGESPQQAVAGLPVTDVRPVAGVSGGYVVDATDSFAALDLADALRQRSGVRSAYPLLRRQYVPR